jgi:hypothetical protein
MTHHKGKKTINIKFLKAYVCRVEQKRDTEIMAMVTGM